MSEAPKPYNPFEARFGRSSTFAIGLVTGIILIAFALFLLVESEWRAGFLAVERTERASMVAVEASAPDPANEGRLVLLAGEVTASGEAPEGAPEGVLSYRVVTEEFDGAAWMPATAEEEEAPVEEDGWFAQRAMMGEWIVPHRLWRRQAEVDLAPEPPVEETPETGARRTRVLGVPAGQYTIAGEQSGDSVSPWRSTITGAEIFAMEPGVLGASDVLPPLDVEDAQFVWMKRAGAFLCVFLGLGTLFGPIGVGRALGPGRWWVAMIALTLGVTILFAGVASLLAAGIGAWMLATGLVLGGAGVVLLRNPEVPEEKEDSPGDAAAGGDP